MTPRERAIAACAPFPVPARLIEHFPHLIGRDGPGNSTETHFTDADLGEAIAMPASEAQLLYSIAGWVAFDSAVEIGAYVGWSTAHILAAAEPFASQMLAVIDPFTESTGAPGATEERFWQNIDRVDSYIKAQVYRAYSPEILPIVKPRHGWDFAFIDGKHTHGQPVADVMGLVPCLSADAVVVLHDAWLPNVKGAIDWLAMSGWTAAELPTANLMTVCYRGDRPHWLDNIEARTREYVARAVQAVTNG
jgi:predicted O-methyltransferase YrrM